MTGKNNCDEPSKTGHNAYARDPAYRKPPNWSRLYGQYFPKWTDGASRHGVMICDQLRDPKDPIRRFMIDSGYEPDHWADSLEVTIKNLWATRKERDKLLGPDECERRFREAVDNATASLGAKDGPPQIAPDRGKR